MGREEQVEEREVLESIFPNEITDISEIEYRITVTLDVPDEDDTDIEPPPVFLLSVRYPDDYPNAAPHLDILAPPHASSHPHFSVSDDRRQLLANLVDAVHENIGMAMVFTIYSTLKEAAEQLIQDRKAVAAAAQEDKAMAAEREENKKFHGTPVTPDSFLKWRDGFLAEMEAQRRRDEDERLAELKKAKAKEPVKLTGRQLWERGLVGKIDEGELEEEDGAPTEGLEQLKVEAA